MINSKDNFIKTVSHLLEEKKAEDLTIINLKANSASLFDTLIIASGTSSKHIITMGEYVFYTLKKEGLKVFSLEGNFSGTEWVLIDIGDIIIHLFKKEARAFYNLEKMWG